MRGTLLTAGLCAVMTAACDGASPARRLFDENVEPILKASCADCHANPNDPHRAPDYLDTVLGDHYASLVSRKDFVGCDVQSSMLLAKGLDPEHPGGALSGPQHDRVEGWLLEEAIERFQGT